MSTRWTPLAGVAAVVCMVVAFGIAGSSPDTEGPDAKISAFYTTHSHQVQNIVGFFVFTVGILFLIAFFAVLRDRLGGGLGGLVFGAGIVSAVFWFTAIAFFTAPGITANDTSRFHLDPNTYRLISDMGYVFWVGAVMTGTVVVWATSAAAAATLPRWFAIAGIVVGVVLLFAVFFFPAFLYGLWVIGASVLLTRRERVSAAAVPQPA